MSFTLTDPRMLAISRGAAGLGTGMGNALEEYVNNKLFADALEKAKGQDPLAMMQTMARSNVDPRNLELAMSPQIQQRLQGQTLAKILGDAYQKYQSGQGTLQDVVISAINASLQSGNTEALPALLKSIAENNYIRNESPDLPEYPTSKKTESPNGVRPPRGNLQEEKTPLPEGQTPFSSTGLMGKQYVDNQAPYLPGVKISKRRAAPEQEVPFAPETEMPTAAQKLQIQKQFMKTYGQEVGEKRFKDYMDFLTTQRNQEIENLKLKQAERKEQMALNKDDREAVNAFWEKNYGSRGLGDEVKLAGIDYALKLKDGTLEERLLKTQSDFWNPIEMSLQTLEKNLPSAPIFSTLNSNEKMEYLNDIHPIVNQAIEKVPEGAKQYIYDMARKKLRQRRGIGPVSAEYAIFKPEQKLIDEYNLLPKPVPEYMHGTYESEAAQQQQNARRQKLSKMLPKIIKKTVGKGMSPLISHNLVVAAGWSDEDWVKAYTEAKDSGLKIDPKFQMADKDAYRPQRPSWKEIILGNPLLELTEIYQ